MDKESEGLLHIREINKANVKFFIDKIQMLGKSLGRLITGDVKSKTVNQVELSS